MKKQNKGHASRIKIKSRYSRKELFGLFYIYNAILELEKKSGSGNPISISTLKKYVKSPERCCPFKITNRNLNSIFCTLTAIGEIFMPRKGLVQRI